MKKILILMLSLLMLAVMLVSCQENVRNPEETTASAGSEITTAGTDDSGSETATGEQFMAEFEANGGTRVSAKLCSVLDSEPVTIREGYRFDGWYLTEDFSDEGVTFPYQLVENTVFFAKWIPVTDDSESESASGETNEETTAGENESETTSDGTNEDTTTGESEKYNATFIVNGGIPVNAMNQISVIESSPVTEKSNYEFKGWHLKEDLSDEAVSFPYTLTADTVFYASWEAKGSIQYTVTFDTNKGSEIPDKTVDQGEYIQQAPETVKSNAEFEGWYTTPDFKSSSKVTFPYEVTDDVIFYAKWKVDTTLSAEQLEILSGYFAKTVYTNFSAAYLMEISNTNGTLYKAVNSYMYDGATVYSRSPYYDQEAGEWETDSNGNYVYYKDWAFLREEDGTYIIYYEDPATGTYVYADSRYSTEPVNNLEDYFYLTYASKIATLNPEQFYCYEGKWYAREGYANEAGQKVLGNTSGDSSELSNSYTEFVLVFDGEGVLTKIEAKSTVTSEYSVGTGIGVTYYYYKHDITISNIGNVKLPTESEFLSDRERPNGLYPTLNPDDNNRNNASSDGVAYSTEELQSALRELTDFTAYYTFAGNTFNGFIYRPVTIYTNGNKGKVTVGDYSYTIGDNSAVQTASADQYFFYDENTGAFFRVHRNSDKTYSVYCDQSSYLNSYYYNQYLLGIEPGSGLILYNCKLPVTELKYIDASMFKYNSNGYFEFNGTQSQLDAFGKKLFGNEDLLYPENNEIESYTYIRIYMSEGKVVKVLAATTLSLSGESTEFFMKELVIKDHNKTEITLPDVDFIAPGEAKENGSTAALENALDASGNNYTYSDEFVYDYFDELVHVNNDIYKYTENLASIAGGWYVYYRDGKPYAMSSDGTEIPIVVNSSNALVGGYKDPVGMANAWIKWGTPLNQLLDADWFYEGKDGNFYGKPEYMKQISEIIGRYSGCEQFLDYPQVGTYTWNVVLEFCSVQIGYGKVTGIYYAGNILIKGTSGETEMPFSGISKFSYNNPTITLPANVSVDSSRPEMVTLYLHSVEDFSIDNSGMLTIPADDRIASYTVNVYDMNKNLVKSIDVTGNVINLKDSKYGLLTANENHYYVSVTAHGNVGYSNSPESATVYVRLAALEVPSAPTVTIDNVNKTVNVSASAPNGYHVSVMKGNEEVLYADFNGTSYSLAALEGGKTYIIKIYAKGDNVNTVDGETVSVRFTPLKSDKSYISELIEAVNGSSSFSVTNSSSSSATYYVYDPEGNKTNNMYLRYYYNATENKGAFTFALIEKDGTIYYDEYVIMRIDCKFSIVDNKIVGTATRKSYGNNLGEESFEMPVPFAAAGQLDESKFTETAGDISKWNGLTYTYTDASAAQSIIEQICPLDELLGKELTYTAFAIIPAYNSDGSLKYESAMYFEAVDVDGNVYKFKMVFDDFGQDDEVNKFI